MAVMNTTVLTKKPSTGMSSTHRKKSTPVTIQRVLEPALKIRSRVGLTRPLTIKIPDMAAMT